MHATKNNFITSIVSSFAFIIALSTSAYGQTYGNEWINYNQKYYSFKIAPPSTPTNISSDGDIYPGVYRIDHSALTNANIPVSTINPENFQLFGKEKEIPLFIVDGNDGSFDPGDYFLFYTERNDGWLDSTMYENPDKIGNGYYSLYNDTLEYFFTWNNSTNNLRYQLETDTDFNNYSPAAYIWEKKWMSYTSVYREGERSSHASSSFYTDGEGWSAGHVNGVNGYTWNHNSASNLTNIYQGIGAPNIEFKAVHTSNSNAAFTGNGNHDVEFSFGSSDVVLIDSIWTGYKGLTLETSIPNGLIASNGNTNFKITIPANQGAVTDYQSTSNWSFKYPRTPNLSGYAYKEFEIDNNSSASKIRLDLSNINYNNSFLLIHGDTPRIVYLTANGASYSALIPNSSNGSKQEVVLENSSQITNITTLTPVNGSGIFTDFLNIPGGIDDALLMIYHPYLEAASLEYSSYREGLGGGYNTILANVEELYQQFGGGIQKHILGVRRFANYIHKNASSAPVGLFLMGKGIREVTVGETTFDGHGTRKDPARFNLSLIPSFGYPSSDIAIASDLPGTTKWVPLMPTGRISARTNQELEDYLNKVKEHEDQQDQNDIYTTPNKDWQKQIIHFGGGSDITQQNQFRGYLNNYKSSIEDSLFGGNVINIFKESSDPLDPSILSGITERIEKGVSLMTYFGHASPTNSGFEINLDNPSNWNNQGKYPFMLVNSCYNGNIFQESISKSEEFVGAPNAGAIAYIASVSVGFDTYLNIYSNSLYKHFAYKNYAESIGEQLRGNVADLETNFNNLILEVTATQMVLNGDPMIKLNYHNKPEIELLEQNVSFSPNNFNYTTDSVEMTIIINNLGKSITDTISIEVRRDFPSADYDSVYYFRLPKLNYKDTFVFKMPVQHNIGIGFNNFDVSIDLPNEHDEQYEEVNNNQITTTLNINIDAIEPVIPYEFAVVPNDMVTVYGSTINPTAAFNTYRFEIDTTDLFNSPLHRYALSSGLGGVHEITPSEWLSTSTGLIAPLICTDSTVYFWRTAIDSTVPQWNESSFQYINGRVGWGQDHYFQFKNNDYFNMAYDRPQRDKDFFPSLTDVVIDVFSSYSVFNAWYINGTLQDYATCSTFPQMMVGVIDPQTMSSWGTNCNGENINYSFGNINDNCGCRNRVEKYFIFQQNNLSQLQSFQNMLINEVPDSHYVLIYTPYQARYDQYNSLDSTNMYNFFQSIGSDSINGSRPNGPMALIYKKGDPNSLVEIIGAPGETINLTTNILGKDNQGTESSPYIGPASEWDNVYWKQDPIEISSTDTSILKIKAYNINKVHQQDFNLTFTRNDSLIDLNSVLDADLYPYIKLEAFHTDTVNFSPAQIDRWHVLYSPLPEAAIDGSTAYYWSQPSDTLSEGDSFDFAIDIRNIFNIDMDSLLVNYWIEDQNNIEHSINYPRQDSLRVGQVLRDTISVNTTGLAGLNSLWIEANPYINNTLDQPEQLHWNNVVQIPFYVNQDDVNPILDVTFNGNHILNGDIVDPNSEILITLKDDNEFLIMDDVSDTTLFGVYLTDPSGNQKRIYFQTSTGETNMQWIPANSQNKKFQIIWEEEFEMDGTYTLLVQGTDRSGNISGDIEYRINFEIIHESTITNMMNYPNPFSTSTRFVFTLTGSEVPDDIIIQIMTVSGRVIREITEDELGLIEIGRNITEYAWDGTDEFGDPLANGVYLYRVFAKIGGEDIKHRESGADSHFKKDFGKMYIIR